MKTLRFKIDNPKRRKDFIQLMKRFFGKELKTNTAKIAIRECDIIEFAFKDNGFISLNKNDIGKI